MSVCAFITDGLCRYLKEHRGEEPAEPVLHPEHKRMFRDEVRAPRAGVIYDGCCFNSIRHALCSRSVYHNTALSTAMRTDSVDNLCPAQGDTPRQNRAQQYKRYILFILFMTWR